MARLPGLSGLGLGFWWGRHVLLLVHRTSVRCCSAGVQVVRHGVGVGVGKQGDLSTSANSEAFQFHQSLVRTLNRARKPEERSNVLYNLYPPTSPCCLLVLVLSSDYAKIEDGHHHHRHTSHPDLPIRVPSIVYSTCTAPSRPLALPASILAAPHPG